MVLVTIRQGDKLELLEDMRGGNMMGVLAYRSGDTHRWQPYDPGIYTTAIQGREAISQLQSREYRTTCGSSMLTSLSDGPVCM